MKAPDKVFVYCDYEGNPDKVDIYPLGKNSIEYIRKDALLEWLKERHAEHSFEVRKAYQRTIEKIESL
ncbi:MAG: hypothetical protein J6N19_15890 [Clostridium sp.]|nr:hypothetical protein [Clostridium sp.]